MTWLERVVSSFIPGPSAVGGTTQIVIGPKTLVTIAPPPRFAWDEKRWRRSGADGGAQLSGKYRVFDRRRRTWREFDGQLVAGSNGIGAYISDPPPEVRTHRHGGCLQLVKAPWFRLHWNTQPKNLDDALLYMEGMLDEAINGQGRKR